MSPASTTSATSSLTPAQLERAREILGSITASLRSRLVGQNDLTTALLVTLLAEGHILIESVPGLAKTLAASTLSQSIDASFSRIQCTPDLLPSDVIGTQVYDAAKAEFETQLGPVHANLVLLDEINRSSAKTQSAMLEAMQERQTSIGGEMHPLPKPFMVLATQNPIEEEGTYILPQAQLDRFLLKAVLDYPRPQEEFEILARLESGVLGTNQRAVSPVVGPEEVVFLQSLTAKVHVADSVKRYIVDLVGATRHLRAVLGEELGSYVDFGASPRASIGFFHVSRALALLAGRDHVIPEDVRHLRHAVLRHRLALTFEAVADRVRPEVIIDALFGAVRTP